VGGRHASLMRPGRSSSPPQRRQCGDWLLSACDFAAERVLGGPRPSAGGSLLPRAGGQRVSPPVPPPGATGCSATRRGRGETRLVLVPGQLRISRRPRDGASASLAPAHRRPLGGLVLGDLRGSRRNAVAGVRSSSTGRIRRPRDGRPARLLAPAHSGQPVGLVVSATRRGRVSAWLGSSAVRRRYG